MISIYRIKAEINGEEFIDWDSDWTLAQAQEFAEDMTYQGGTWVIWEDVLIDDQWDLYDTFPVSDSETYRGR